MTNKSLEKYKTPDKTRRVAFTAVNKRKKSVKKPDPKNTQSIQEQKDYIARVLKDSSDKKQMNSDSLTLFPDVKLGLGVLKTSIMSAKTFTLPTLTTVINTNVPIPNTISGITAIIKRHTKELGMVDELDSIVGNCLGGSGSTLKAIIPRSSLDNILSTATMSYNVTNIDSVISNSKSYVDDAKFTVLNTDMKELHIGVTDKIDVLRRSAAVQHYNTQRNLEQIETGFGIKINVAVQSADNKGKNKKPTVQQMPLNTDIGSGLIIKAPYKDKPKTNKQHIIVVPKAGDLHEIVNQPILMDIDGTAVMPVTIPGNFNKPIFFVVLLDSEGVPIVKTQEKKVTIPEGSSFGSILKKANKNLNTMKDSEVDGTKLKKMYKSYVHDSVQTLLKESSEHTNLNIGIQEHHYETMLHNTLAETGTKLLVIPAELATYFALEYRANGTGKTKLESIHNLLSLRAVLRVTKIMSQIASSIPQTVVTVDLDPETPDVVHAQKLITAKLYDSLNVNEITGLNRVEDISKYFHRAGFVIRYTGHDDLPNTKITYEKETLDVPDINTDLEESLEKDCIKGLDILPEMVDGGFGADFATTDQANGILFHKKVALDRRKLNKLVTQHVTRYCRYNQLIIDEMVDVIVANKTEIVEALNLKGKHKFEEVIGPVINELLDSTGISLPEIDIDMSHLAGRYSDYADMLEEVIDDIWFTSDMIDIYNKNDAVLKDFDLDNIKAGVKSYFLRRWCQENDYMSEIMELVSGIDKKGFDIINRIGNHQELILTTIAKITKLNSAKITKLEKNLNDIEPSESDIESSEDVDSSVVDDPNEDVDTDEEVPIDDSESETLPE